VVFSQQHWHAVRPAEQSVAAVTTRRFNRGQNVEAQIDNRLKSLRRRCSSQRLWQGVEPCGATRLDVDQFARGIAPTLDAAPAINRPTRANDDRCLLFLVARAIAPLPLGIAQGCLTFG